MSPRSEYFQDLVEDCAEALADMGIAPGTPEYGAIVAGMILSDAINGLRKALLIVNGQRG